MQRAAAEQSDIDLRDRDVGVQAESPGEIPARGWRQIIARARAESKDDQVPLMAAGVAFFGFLSLFPAMVAAMLLYGLVSTPQGVQQQINGISGIIPASARSLILDQLTSVAAAPAKGLGIGLVVSALLALWSASGGVRNLVSAVNLAYDEDENRGFVKRKGLALLMTVGAIAFFGVVIGLLAVFPAVISATDRPARRRAGRGAGLPVGAPAARPRRGPGGPVPLRTRP